MRRAQGRARSARARKIGARSATIKSRALGALKLASEARDENVPAKWADFFFIFTFFIIVLFYLLLFTSDRIKSCSRFAEETIG